jgi:signal transduction histidine kinase
LAKENLFEQLPTPIYVIENSGQILAMNAFAKRHIPETTIQTFLKTHPEIISSSTPKEYDIIHTQEPQEMSYQVRVNPLRNRYHTTIGHTLVLMDITALQESKERLYELATLKSRVFSVLAHDVSSNLSGVELLAEMTLLHSQSQKTNMVDHNLQQIKRGISSARSVLRGLLDRVKTENSETTPEAINTEALFQSIHQEVCPLSELKQIQWSVDLTKLDDLWIQTDREMMHSAVRNILNNAIRMSPYRGTIQIQGYATPTSWSLHISDQGPGMSEKNLNLLNSNLQPEKEDTSQTTSFGMGIGVVQDFLQRIGGSLRGENTYPGLKIIMELPLTTLKKTVLYKKN